MTKEILIPLTVNGKQRSSILVSRDTNKEDLEQLAREDKAIRQFIGDRAIVHITTVPKCFVNFIVN